IDDQINIRGYRIEPSEIEHCLLEYPNVKEAVVVIQTDYLCAYVIVDDGYIMNDLRKYLKQSLPPYMVPTHIIEMEKMPLTSNGKLDRKALPLPEIQSVEEYVAPT
ncbi:AMP-binding enzyme, partial [Bacillus altitudinis]|uniref:AMP-binding enzyme n=1 Tax=Bacillus altitudinis TaxID=293387 RepID=UPI001643197C